MAEDVKSGEDDVAETDITEDNVGEETIAEYEVVKDSEDENEYEKETASEDETIDADVKMCIRDRYYTQYISHVNSFIYN